MNKIKYEYGDKKKLTEVKKKFKIDQFIKILNSKENPSIFDALEEITKVEISVNDEFTSRMGLIDFSKKISNQLTYVPLITFAAYNESISSLLDFGLLRCILNKKKDFQIYLIKSDIVTKGIPYGDIVSINYFELNKEEIIACDELIKKIKKEIEIKDNSVKGFNIGTNSGKVAGQSIMHCHIHLIPRREGDVESPQGGVRSVIPLKQHYIRKV